MISSYCATLYYPLFPLDRRRVEMFYIEMDYRCITLTRRISDWKFQSCEISATSLFINHHNLQHSWRSYQCPSKMFASVLPLVPTVIIHAARKTRSIMVKNKSRLVPIQFQSLLESIINYRLLFVIDSIWFAFDNFNSTNSYFKNWSLFRTYRVLNSYLSHQSGPLIFLLNIDQNSQNVGIIFGPSAASTIDCFSLKAQSAEKFILHFHLIFLREIA